MEACSPSTLEGDAVQCLLWPASYPVWPECTLVCCSQSRGTVGGKTASDVLFQTLAGPSHPQDKKTVSPPPSFLVLCPLRPPAPEGREICLLALTRAGAWRPNARSGGNTEPCAGRLGQSSWRDCPTEGQAGYPWTCSSHQWESRGQLQRELAFNSHLLSHQKLQAYQSGHSTD